MLTEIKNRSPLLFSFLRQCYSIYSMSCQVPLDLKSIPANVSCSLVRVPLMLKSTTNSIRQTQTTNSTLRLFPVVKNCLGMPRMTYLIRTCPLWKFEQIITEFDDTIQQSLRLIENGN